ncbi:hypothetical protein V6N13_034001 [Hibiscus sabdariffa]
MEADDGADSTLHDDKNDQPVVDATTKGEDVCGAGKVSYADMVVSSTKSSMGDALATKFVEEEVVILDEDVQMDTKDSARASWFKVLEGDDDLHNVTGVRRESNDAHRVTVGNTSSMASPVVLIVVETKKFQKLRTF